MKTVFLLLSFLSFLTLQAAETPQIAELQTADDQRVAALVAADPERLSSILADELRYAHSTGVVDTKQEFINSIVEKRLQYLTIRYEQRDFTLVGPEVALMTGRAVIKAATPTGGTADVRLGFLAVWRLEKGHWRFLAWQSNKLAPSPETAKDKKS